MWIDPTHSYIERTEDEWLALAAELSADTEAPNLRRPDWTRKGEGFDGVAACCNCAHYKAAVLPDTEPPPTCEAFDFRTHAALVCDAWEVDPGHAEGEGEGPSKSVGEQRDSVVDNGNGRQNADG
jgi:hypothetical protein